MGWNWNINLKLDHSWRTEFVDLPVHTGSLILMDYFSLPLQKLQKLLTSLESEAWWWTLLHTRHWWILSAQLLEFCPVFLLHTNRSVCVTWTLSPVQRSLRITYGWSTVRVKNLNPTGQCVSLCLTILYLLEMLSYVSPVFANSCLCLLCDVCSSIHLHSLSEGDQEYFLLEECESKTLYPQASQWVAGPTAGSACLCGVLHLDYKEKREFSKLKLD